MGKKKSYFADVKRRRHVERVIFGLLNEDLNADATVLVYSVTDGGRTRTRCITFGNSLACRGLIEWVGDEAAGDEIEESALLDDEDDEDDD